MTLSFRDGIYVLSLLRCLQKGEIDLKSVEKWKCCTEGQIRLYDDEYKKSYLRPNIEIDSNLIINLNKKVLALYQKYKNDYRLEALDNFLKKNYLRIRYKDGKTINDWKNIEELFQEYNLQVPEINEISQETLENFAKPYLSALENLWRRTYPNNKLEVLSREITSFKYKFEYGINGCIIENNRNSIIKNDMIDNLHLMQRFPKLDEDFYVYRSIRESKSYNPENKIGNLLLGREVIEEYPTMISTTWDLNFALGWSEIGYCCLYVIKVPKESNYLILKDSFDMKDKNSQHEITLAPGIITFNKIYTCDVKFHKYSSSFTKIYKTNYNKTIFVFVGEYKSYNSEEEIVEHYVEKLCTDEDSEIELDEDCKIMEAEEEDDEEDDTEIFDKV